MFFLIRKLLTGKKYIVKFIRSFNTVKYRFYAFFQIIFIDYINGKINKYEPDSYMDFIKFKFNAMSFTTLFIL
jgi:hypothetical protein